MIDKQNIEALEALTEKPVQFTLEGRVFTIKPPTIGKQALLSRYIEEIDFDEEVLMAKPIREANRLFNAKNNVALRIMAIAVSNGKKELLDESHLREVEDYFRWNAEPALFADIVKIVVSMADYVNFSVAIRLLKTLRLKTSTDNLVAEEKQQ